jgi:hypothetical protein
MLQDVRLFKLVREAIKRLRIHVVTNPCVVINPNRPPSLHPPPLLQAPDLSIIPTDKQKVLHDVWLFKLVREAPNKAYMLIK